MITIMAIVGERDGIDLTGLGFSGEKHMANSPRQVSQVSLKIQMPAGLDSTARGKLERAAMTSPSEKISGGIRGNSSGVLLPRRIGLELFEF